MITGRVALMGSGELTGTMVEIHKELLGKYGPRGKAVFLDTPAGFQLNVDLISQRAREYFIRHVGHEMEVASFKCAETVTPREAENAYRALGEADFVLIGPGSPTYAVRQLMNTPIPSLLGAMVTRGGCLVAASAAALTMGSHTLPVYEIYKVGATPHWVEGLNLLKPLGLDLVVIPHWNNAEGGNHDTRFCYMGEPRFRVLEGMLPEGATVLGLDEHTACIFDFSAHTIAVEGIGRITIRRRGRERLIANGDRVPFEYLRLADGPETAGAAALLSPFDHGDVADRKGLFWGRARQTEASFYRAVEERDWVRATSLMLEMDRLLWQAQHDGESQEYISQAREVFREMLVHAGDQFAKIASAPAGSLERIVLELLALREDFRRSRKWEDADEIRRCLQRAGIVVEDTAKGPQWRMARHERGG